MKRRQIRPRRTEVKGRSLLWLIAFFLGLFMIVMLTWGQRGSAGWGGEGPYRLLEIGSEEGKAKEIRLIELIPEAQKARVLTIPLSLKLGVHGHAGTYEVRGIYTLSHSETRKTDLFKQSLEQGLGLIVNATRETTVPLSETVTKGDMYKIFLVLLKQRQVTVGEWWNLLTMMQQLPSDFLKVDVASLSAAIESIEVDESTVISLHQAAFDEWYTKQMPVISPTLRDITVTVENTTLKEGLGSQVARMLTHQGLKVVNVTDGLPVTSSEVIVSEALIMKKPQLRRLVASWLPSIRLRTADISAYRSDMLVRVAPDW